VAVATKADRSSESGEQKLFQQPSEGDWQFWVQRFCRQTVPWWWPWCVERPLTKC